ncbi:MAG: glycosyl transferase family 2 [Firmicutes bacterium]|nr:glycosyl transferase family 2 [Bacillota bacterium]
MDITIIVVAYNRKESLKRILLSLNNARYDDDRVRLIISIDKSENDDILQIANDCLWDHGEKIVEMQSEHLGLHRHVIKCGDMSEKYSNIILLEDDLYVSPNFYRYSKSALSFYKLDKQIAGISLYSQKFNESAWLPFEPIKSNGDTFFMQLASSWGQVWCFEQWSDFKKWYFQNISISIDESSKLPMNIVMWPETSWKKYFMKYLVEKDKYFVYPYISHTTNFGDKGTHFKDNTDTFQVALDMTDNPIYKFYVLNESISVYDIFCENINLYKILEIIPEHLTIDIYGIKKINLFKRYILSSQILHYKVVKSFDLALRPQELNIIESLYGEKIFLYDKNEEVPAIS